MPVVPSEADTVEPSNVIAFVLVKPQVPAADEVEVKVPESVPLLPYVELSAREVPEVSSSFRVLSALVVGWVVVLHLVATGQGMSLSEDSALYMGSARNLLAGHGLTVPFGTPEPALLTQYPPFYAVLLAGHKLTGMPMLEFARWLNALFAVVTVLLVIRLSRSITGGALATAALAAVLVVSSTRMIAVDAMVMSEPAMICLGTLGLVALVRFLGPRDGASLTMLLVAGGLAGLAALTRYVGAAYGLGHRVDMSIFVLNTTSMLGLGVAIDYSLFMVNRFRDELTLGRDHEQAVANTVATSGRAILVSALVVAVVVYEELVAPAPLVVDRRGDQAARLRGQADPRRRPFRVARAFGLVVAER